MSTPTHITLSECTLKSKTSKDSDYPSYITRIYVTLRHPHHGKLASIEVLRIKRDAIRKGGEEFLMVMDADSSETQEFSSTIFDGAGNVKRYLVEKGSFRCGTGVWGEEMNKGDVVYLKDMNVKEQYRNQGVGTHILNEFLGNAAQVPKDAVVYCWPVPVPATAEEKEEFERIKARQIAFFRKNHFRRVGRTPFFAYSSNPGHPSRLIPIDADVESLSDTFPGMREACEMSMEEKTRNYPLHVAITNVKDPSISGIIQAAYSVDPTSIHKRDPSGFTPLFVASANMNVSAVRALLSWDMEDDLKDYSNGSGMTPLEGVIETMEGTKEFAVAMLQRWEGHSVDGLSVEYELKKAMGKEEVDGVRIEEFVSKRVYGCTCGQCVGGWFSPRMRYQLMCQAALGKDGMSMELMCGTFTPHQVLSPSDISILPNADFIPPSLHRHFYKTFYAGYQTLFSAAYSVLTDPTNPILSVQTILTHLTSEGTGNLQPARYYFDKGGKVEYVLDAITYAASEQLRDGSFEESWGDEEDWGMLGRCGNDDNFGLVRRFVGLDDVRERWGPYLVGMDMDDDEEFGVGMGMGMGGMRGMGGMGGMGMGGIGGMGVLGGLGGMGGLFAGMGGMGGMGVPGPGLMVGSYVVDDEDDDEEDEDDDEDDDDDEDSDEDM